jgi:hypothetical protein
VTKMLTGYLVYNRDTSGSRPFCIVLIALFF